MAGYVKCNAVLIHLRYNSRQIDSTVLRQDSNKMATFFCPRRRTTALPKTRISIRGNAPQ